MSSYINSLLVELGIRDPPHRHHHHRYPDQADSARNESTKLPTTTDLPILTPDKDCVASDLSAGDAASLHGTPPFFTTLLKDMDRRNSERERPRSTHHDGEFSSPTTPVTANSLTDNSQNIDTNITDLSDTRPQDGHPAALGEERTGGDAQPRRASQHRLGQNMDNNTLTPEDGSGSTSLPADDGMGWLRKKIHAIMDLELDNNEKARRVHDLMTEKYKSFRATMPKSPTLSPSIIQNSLGSPVAEPKPSPSDPCPTSPASDTSAPLYESHFTLTAEDLQPTYVPRAEPDPLAVDAGEEAGEEAGDDPDTEELEEASLGCQHYKRNVKLQCFTCKKWYTCRFCHDEVEEHPLVRRDTENMLCMLCGHAQPAAQNCQRCGEQTAQYYCDICKLWDNDSKKSIYHCHDCGICRIGQGLGKDFFHCKTCCVCLPISIEDTHRCIERSTQCDCPICGEYMFTSPETVVVMRCGHSLHHKCLSEYSKTSFRCPICSKTITNMESTFRNLDRTIESQPMPAEFTDTRGLVYCNDCGAKSVVKYHWLGLKCDLCESYNTAQIRLLQGDISGVLEEEGMEDEPHSRQRSASMHVADEASTSLAALHMNNSPPSQSRLSVPAANGSNNRIVSYNMAHNRAISPVVSNYFGLPTERESEKPSSLPFFGNPLRSDGDTDYGALNFLSKKLRDRYGFLSNDTTTTENKDAVEEDDEDAESSSSSGSEDAYEDDDEDDGVEPIDLLGHR